MFKISPVLKSHQMVYQIDCKLFCCVLQLFCFGGKNKNIDLEIEIFYLEAVFV